MSTSRSTRVWTWVVLLIPLPLIAWSAYLLVAAAHTQRELRVCVDLIAQFEELDRQVRDLERELYPSAGGLVEPALVAARAQLARIPEERAGTLGITADVEAVGAAVSRLEDLYRAPPAGLDALELLDAARQAGATADAALARMVRAARRQTGAVAIELADRWRALNVLVISAGLLAILLVLLLRAYWASAAARKRAEQERDRFFEASVDPLCIADGAGHMQQLNPAWQQILGYSLEELKARPYLEFVHPDDRAALAGFVAELARAPARLSSETRVRTRSGEYRWLMWNACSDPARDRIYALARDVTEWKAAQAELAEAQAALRESETRYRLLADSMEDFVNLNDAHGHRLYVSPSFFRATGYSSEEVLSTDFRLRVHPEDLPAVEAARAANLRGEKTRIEYRTLTRGGEPIWLEMQATPIAGPDGQVDKILCCSRNITDRKRAEQALAESAARLRAIVETAVHGILTVDAHGIIESFNPACERMFGYAAAEAIGQEVGLLMPEEYRASHAVHVADCTRGDPSSILGLGREVAARRRDGTRFPAHVAVSAVRLGDRLMFTAIVHDITDLKHAQAELQATAERLARSNRELQDFAAVASHDLQEPLRKVIAFGERLLSGHGGTLDAAGQDYLARMRSAAGRMQTLIQGLLAYARVTTHAQPFLPVDLNALVAEVLSDLEVRIDEDQARVSVGPLPTLAADPLQMRQLFQNLISNALKFRRPGVLPEIAIGVAAPDGTPGPAGSGFRVHRIFVRDNGVGFEQSEVGRIFQIFQRLHGRNEFEGAGIGLAVCRKIVERHGGAIVARGVPGEGATFTVLLPETPRREEPPPAAAAAGDQAGPVREDRPAVPARCLRGPDQH